MEDLKDKVATAHRILHQQQLADYLGHVSARVPDTDRFYIKTISLSLQNTTREHILTVDFDGNFIDGTGKVPSEAVLHGEVYKVRPDVGSVVHTHQKWATAFGIAGRRLLPLSHPGLSDIVADPIPVYESAELITRSDQGRDVAKMLGNGQVCHLRNHGMLIVGPSIEDAIYRTINLERQAELNYICLQLGQPKVISTELMDSYREWEEKVLVKEHRSVALSAWVYFSSLVTLSTSK